MFEQVKNTQANVAKRHVQMLSHFFSFFSENENRSLYYFFLRHIQTYKQKSPAF